MICDLLPHGAENGVNLGHLEKIAGLPVLLPSAWRTAGKESSGTGWRSNSPGMVRKSVKRAGPRNGGRES